MEEKVVMEEGRNYELEIILRWTCDKKKGYERKGIKRKIERIGKWKRKCKRKWKGKLRRTERKERCVKKNKVLII